METDERLVEHPVTLPVVTAGDARRVIDFLDDLARSGPVATGTAGIVDAPMVDEAERERIAAVAAGRPPAATWEPLAVERDGRTVAYLGMREEPVGGRTLAVELALADVDGAVLDAALSQVRDGAAAVERVELWMRRVDEGLRARVGDAGFSPARRLAVLGHRLDDTHDGEYLNRRIAHEGSSAFRIRPFAPEQDTAAVVAALASAYAGTPDDGWDEERFAERSGAEWFDPQDILVAETVDDRVVGLVWMKRRVGQVAEIYNLAIHRDVTGHGIGPRLLAAGLGHLAWTGCREVILWVDRANERALRLYERSGFELRWEDVLFSSGAPRDMGRW